ncbi:MAG TPA: recombinase family protein [Candidatus Copromorpha excrementigallinarum]|uniref:Recombinase family protein n=1 Tax=Candidatus Allocopromorpha excrementigallinarum TaxID=2840742 RepID=A0A9D1I0C4_9FIRM|nr:recombinase family protein [Candidatus Copromorpha excrementigallinarum]
MVTVVFFIYSRKSVYTGKGESIENQIEMCRRYIDDKFADAEEKDIFIYEDEGFSARNTKRPMFRKMLRDLDAKSPDFIVCYRLDRISRSVSDFSRLIEDLNSRHISFICIKEEFDTSKPMGKAMMYIASVFSQLERETIAERVRDNMLMLARTGRWLGGTPPTGYRASKVRETVLEGKIKTSCMLKEQKSEITVVEDIFRFYLETGCLSAVSRRLLESGTVSRTGRPYSLPGIKQILQNPVYCRADAHSLRYFSKMGSEVCFSEKDFQKGFGLMAYNKRDYSRKSAPRRPVSQWILAAGKHRGLIDGESWVRVQELLSSGSSASLTEEGTFLMKGLLFCGECGSLMYVKKRASSSGGKLSYDYICSQKLKKDSKACNCRNLSGPSADEAVFSSLLKLININTLPPEAFKAPGGTRPSSDPYAAAGSQADEISRLLLQPSFIFSTMPRHEKSALVKGSLQKALWKEGVLHLFLSP